jgi:hypothetical protein
VIAAGDDAEASEASLTAPASVVAPSLLLTEAELQRSETKPEKAPILPPPQPFAPEAEGRLEKPRRAPILPKGAFIQINRYLLSGRAEPIAEFDVEGVAAWRQTRLPDGLALDVKVVGSNLKTAGAAVRRADAAAAALVKGGVHKTVLWPMRGLAGYRARYDDGWPDDGPR